MAAEVRTIRRPRVPKHRDEAIAVVRPVLPSSRRRVRRQATPPPALNAWLEGLVGIANSDGPDDTSANIHTYVAEATYSGG
jgi:hypothetical protein